MPAGEVTFQLANSGTQEHEFEIFKGDAVVDEAEGLVPGLERDLVVTLEPCTMCAGAVVLSRLDRLVYGALDPRAGAVDSLWDVVRDRRLNHRAEVIGGTLADESSMLLRAFFGAHR